MRKFLIKFLLFVSIPTIVYCIAEMIASPTLFSFRHWEGLNFYSKIPTRYGMYPNIASSINAAGDLCHHTKNAINKEEFWKTDKFGFRNDSFIEDPDVVIIGDSFIAGCGLSQQEILSNKIKEKTKDGLKIYNMASCNFSDFDEYLNEGLIKKPKLIIFSRVERIVPEPIVKVSKLKTKFRDLFEIANANVYIDKALKRSSFVWLKARIHGATGNGIPGIGIPKMFFMNEKDYQKHKPEDAVIAVEIINSYKKYCDSIGIKFLYLPMPDKETVYYDMVPYSKQPDYLFKVDWLLQNKNVPTVNTLKIYNEFRKSNNTLLYRLDDSHWTPAAIDLVSDEIVKKILLFRLFNNK